MRAVSLHRDVIVVTSALLQVNCVIVRGPVSAPVSEAEDQQRARATPAEQPVAVIAPAELSGAPDTGETFIVDSPVLPDELDALPRLLEQAGFPEPSGLLATHADWDHLLGRLAFPGCALGCAESTVERLQAAPGEAQRELRAFDEGLMIERPRPLALGSVQELPVPGRCDVGDRALELHPADGHTRDGMAVLIPWAGVLLAGDYLSPLELPLLSDGGSVDAYLRTVECLLGLIPRVEHIVPGHGPVLDADRALALGEEDASYLRALAERGAEAELPPTRRGARQRQQHSANVAALA
jgi:glyoxylase-like metal-dependent hydrolase (beta-lactamase superfamily II)